MHIVDMSEVRNTSSIYNQNKIGAGSVENSQRRTDNKDVETGEGVTVEFSKEGMDILKTDIEKRLQQAIEEAKQFAPEDDGLTKEERALKEKQEAAQMLDMMERELEATRKNAEAMEEAFDDLAKILIVARRIMNGDKVPGKDEKKLMEYDNGLYQACKAAGMLKKVKERKEYDSLWEDEENNMDDKVKELDSGEVIDKSQAPAPVEAVEITVPEE